MEDGSECEQAGGSAIRKDGELPHDPAHLWPRATSYGWTLEKPSGAAKAGTVGQLCAAGGTSLPQKTGASMGSVNSSGAGDKFLHQSRAKPTRAPSRWAATRRGDWWT